MKPFPPPPTIRIPSPTNKEQANPIQQIPFVPPPSLPQAYQNRQHIEAQAPEDGVMRRLYQAARNIAHRGLSAIQTAIRRVKGPSILEEKKEPTQIIKLKDLKHQTQQFEFYPSLQVTSKKDEPSLLTQSQIDTVKYLQRESGATEKKIEEFIDVSNLEGDELILPTAHDLERIKRIHKLQ